MEALLRGLHFMGTDPLLQARPGLGPADEVVGLRTLGQPCQQTWHTTAPSRDPG
jgi:hypothetical protein